MATQQIDTLALHEQEELLQTLKARFEKNMHRHQSVEWAAVVAKLHATPEKLWSLYEMERTGGEPDVVSLTESVAESESHQYTFVDCAAESPSGRRSICYDHAALEARKEHKPKDSAQNMAAAMGIELLSEENYRALQRFGKYDTKTSSWISTPSAIRSLGGALFCDCRYNAVFVYHNGAESYYAARGFRGLLRL